LCARGQLRRVVEPMACKVLLAASTQAKSSLTDRCCLIADAVTLLLHATICCWHEAASLLQALQRSKKAHSGMQAKDVALTLHESCSCQQLLTAQHLTDGLTPGSSSNGMQLRAGHFSRYSRSAASEHITAGSKSNVPKTTYIWGWYMPSTGVSVAWQANPDGNNKTNP
jgi:hypothetical protein